MNWYKKAKWLGRSEEEIASDYRMEMEKEKERDIKKTTLAVSNAISLDDFKIKLQQAMTQFGAYILRIIKSKENDPITLSNIMMDVKNGDSEYTNDEGWFEFETLEEYIEEVREGEAEARDPYGYRGLSQKDFI